MLLLYRLSNGALSAPLQAEGLMTKVNTSYSAMAPTIRRRWKEAQLIPNRIAVADKKVDQILEPAARARYELIERETGVPWPLIAVKHMREANNNFKGVLHNGQAIVGTGRLHDDCPGEHGPFRDVGRFGSPRSRLYGSHEDQIVADRTSSL